MGIEKANTYTAYLTHGITVRLEVRENEIIELSAYWANSERMELEELCIRPADLSVMAELFAMAGQKVNA
jgi:hypothetical protein